MSGKRVHVSVADLWDERYAFNASNIEHFPLCPGRPGKLAQLLDGLSTARVKIDPASIVTHGAISRTALEQLRRA